jgi:formylmethanofuran dehydrogenase subunit D
VRVAAEDLARLRLADGDRVRLSSAWGRGEAIVSADTKGDLPSGVIFVAYGELSARLTGPDTGGSGMPTGKAIDVVVERI